MTKFQIPRPKKELRRRGEEGVEGERGEEKERAGKEVKGDTLRSPRDQPQQKGGDFTCRSPREQEYERGSFVRSLTAAPLSPTPNNRAFHRRKHSFPRTNSFIAANSLSPRAASPSRSPSPSPFASPLSVIPEMITNFKGKFSKIFCSILYFLLTEFFSNYISQTLGENFDSLQTLVSRWENIKNCPNFAETEISMLKQLLEVSLLYSPGDLVAVEIAEIPKSHRYRPTR